MKRLKDKLYDYEVSPPPGTWKKITAVLDESLLTAEFPKTLYGLEVKPPQATWSQIASALDEEPAVVIPARRSFGPLLRYAAAAVTAGLILLAGLRIFNSNTSDDPGLVGKTIQEPQIKVNTFPNLPPDENAGSVSAESRDDAALEASKHTVARLDYAGISKNRNQSEELRTEPIFTMAAFTDLNPAETYKELDYSEALRESSHEENLSISANRYVMLMTPDGQFIRMSKKLGDLLCCVSGEEQDPDCIDQMKRWRQKIAISNLTPSPGNFMDILNLVKSLQENRE